MKMTRCSSFASLLALLCTPRPLCMTLAHHLLFLDFLNSAFCSLLPSLPFTGAILLSNFYVDLWSLVSPIASSF
jgi:hypothetical protein